VIEAEKLKFSTSITPGAKVISRKMKTEQRSLQVSFYLSDEERPAAELPPTALRSPYFFFQLT